MSEGILTDAEPFTPQVPDSDLSGYPLRLNKLSRFGGNFVRAGMVRSFLVSTEYRRRFGPWRRRRSVND